VKNTRSKFMLAGSLCCGLGVACMFYSPVAFPLYTPLFFCALVIAVIMMAKDRLWSGLGLLLITTTTPGILLLLLVVIPSGEEIQDRFKEWRSPIVAVTDSDQVVTIGEQATTVIFELSVTSVSRRRRVGSLLRGETPSPGAVYLVVTWKYRNISERPVQPRSKPTISIISPRGALYVADIPANSAVRRGRILSGAAASSVNPGIEIEEVNVFEVPKGDVGKDGWQIAIKADEQIDVLLNW